MLTVDLNQLDLNEFTAQNDARQRCKVTFPLLGVHGSQDTAAVYFELAPGDHLGRHTDSAEEVLVILAGEVEASVGEETAPLRSGQIAVVPKMLPHDVRNVGSTPAKVLGVFGGANHIVASFEQGWQPDGNQVVDTAAMTSPEAC